jgi:catechol 2,3-dioxygenase-like lactoylglutathione lyase family enzyme
MFVVMLVAMVRIGPSAPAQHLDPPNPAGVRMGHVHYTVQNVDANRDFWVRLGGTPGRTFGSTAVVGFPGLMILLSEGPASGNSEGSVVNHLAFRVRALSDVEAAGFDVEHLEGYQGIGSVFTPEGERIELFDETATNMGFTTDTGRPAPVADRHNRPLATDIASHHIHLYVPEADVARAKAWYATTFGATPGMRWRYDAVDLPGINFNFSASPAALEPTTGRMLDHIGLEVDNLEAFCRQLESAGIRLDEPYTMIGPGIGTAVLTDPWGTRIELTEGFDSF